MKKKKKQTAGRKWILQLFLLLGISLLAGVLFEGLYEMKYLQALSERRTPGREGTD